MSRAFADIVFTPAVLREQEKRGQSPWVAQAMAPDEERVDSVGPQQAEFIQRIDGFFQATLSETGWPYVQYRGGPKGFLKILDKKTIAYSDYSGNRQHVSAGNLTVDNRVSLILMDHVNSGRLKIWGRARIEDDSDLIDRLHDKGYRARPERAIVIDVEALDWNCPAHIPIRLTMEEQDGALSEAQQQILALRKEIVALKSRET